MLKLIRLLMLVATPLLFCGVWYIQPSLLEGQGLKWFASLVSVLWTLEFFFFQRLIAISGVDGLTSQEHEKLVLRLAQIRRRVWWIGGVGLVSAVVIWVLATLNLPMTSAFFAGAVGFLVGISLSYMILIPSWMNESQRFMDEAKRQDTLAKNRAATTKALDSS